MKTKTRIIIGGTGSTFQYLSQQLEIAGYSTKMTSANPLEIQYQTFTFDPSAVFLNSASDNIMVLIDNLIKLKNAPAVYIVQSPYEMTKNKKLESITNYYFTNPIDINLILETLRSDLTKRETSIINKFDITTDIHNTISELLNKLCVTPNYNGYMYLREAIKMAVLEPINSRGFSTRMYPEIANKYGVSVASIERNIRTAIIKCWEKASLIDKTDIFGAFSAKSEWHPTNGEFILIIADKINRTLCGHNKVANF